MSVCLLCLFAGGWLCMLNLQHVALPGLTIQHHADKHQVYQHEYVVHPCGCLETQPQVSMSTAL